MQEVFCNWTASTKAALSAELAQAMLAYAKPVEVVAGFKCIKPMPPRSNRIDKETILVRRNIPTRPTAKRIPESVDPAKNFALKLRDRSALAQEWAELGITVFCRKYGIGRTSVSRRIKKGSTPYEAVMHEAQN